MTNKNNGDKNNRCVFFLSPVSAKSTWIGKYSKCIFVRPLSPSQCWPEAVYAETHNESTFILQHLALSHLNRTLNIVLGGWGSALPHFLKFHAQFADTGTLKLKIRESDNAQRRRKIKYCDSLRPKGTQNKSCLFPSCFNSYPTRSQSVQPVDHIEFKISRHPSKMNNYRTPQAEHKLGHVF